MNRGNAFHRRQVERIAEQWRLFAPAVFTEHRITGGGTQTFVDVFVDFRGYSIAVEIELSTRHLLDNTERALRVGIDEVHLVFPTAVLRRRAHRLAAQRMPRQKLERTRFLLLSPYAPMVYCRKSRQKSEKKPW